MPIPGSNFLLFSSVVRLGAQRERKEPSRLRPVIRRSFQRSAAPRTSLERTKFLALSHVLRALRILLRPQRNLQIRAGFRDAGIALQRFAPQPDRLIQLSARAI